MTLPARAMCACALAALLCAPALARDIVTGSGHAATEERAVAGYHGISIALPAQVELRQGSPEGVTLTADDNVLARVRAYVERGFLQLRFASGVEVRPATPIRIVVGATAVDSLQLAGSVRLQSARLEGERLRVKLAGPSAASLPQLAVRQVSLETSGHCHAMLGGRAERFELRVAGAGEVNAARLEARTAKVSIAGSAQVALWVHEKLAVDVTGSGAVRYFGDPALARAVSGTARIERLGPAPP